MKEALASPKDAALKLALEALEDSEDHLAKPYSTDARRAITAIKEALAQHDKEPVAWRFQSAVGGWAYGKEPPIGSKYAVEPLYTTPPQLEERNFCPRCGKRTADLTVIHTCTPPQPEQEPVAFLVDDDLYYPEEIDWETLQEQGHTVAALYTSPPQRKPLTDEEIADLWSAQIFHINDLKLAKDFVRDIEAAHGIKE